MITAKITSKGQITIPLTVRNHLHLAEGERVEFLIRADGTVELTPVGGSVENLFGLTPQPSGEMVSQERLDEILIEEAEAENERCRKAAAPLAE